MTNLINEAVNIINQYNPKLAKAWKSQPFKRLTFARAFAVGFVNSPEDDIHPDASRVFEISILDRDSRA